MGSNTVILTADGRISAQRALDQDSTKDQVEVFLFVDYNLSGISMQLQQYNQNSHAFNWQWPIPTPHAVPHQISPAQRTSNHDKSAKSGIS